MHGCYMCPCAMVGKWVLAINYAFVQDIPRHFHEGRTLLASSGQTSKHLVHTILPKGLEWYSVIGLVARMQTCL